MGLETTDFLAASKDANLLERMAPSNANFVFTEMSKNWILLIRQ